MEGLPGRILRFWLATLVGTALGWLLGRGLAWPVVGAMAGGLAGLTLALLRDARRAARLADWLRDPQQTAPRDPGLWGELGYRAERLVRALQQDIGAERRHLAQFLSAIEASPNGVLLLDPADHIEWCNAMATLHLGLDAQRDRGQPVTNLVRAPEFVAHMQGPARAGSLLIPQPGREGTVSVMLRPYADGRTLVLTQDVTERLRTDTMRRDFVANVSHEIRSPLTVLAGFVETMATLPLTEGERQRVLALMKQQTDRMQVLVSDLLALARLEGSPRPPLDRWVHAAALLSRVKADALVLSAGRHELHVDAPQGAQLAGQESELFSAVANLVSNAVRYTPAQGRIEVRWVDRADGSAALEVADTGIGIAREHLPRLAERFYRVDSSRSRDTGGTGLGLAIAKHAVQRHGGELEVDSEPGKGSRFRLVFPAARVRRDMQAQQQDVRAVAH